MAMGMGNKEALRAHKAHHLFGTTPNCHSFAMANGTPAEIFFPSVRMLQCYPRFKNLGFGCKSLELCADVASDVGIKVKSRLLRFL